MNGRWQFSAGLSVAALALLGAAASGDPTATHNMLVVGERTVYLSHLPMFQEKNQPPMPHRYQAILEATFAKQEDYAKDCQAHPATTIYTLNPAEFVLPDLVSQGQPLQSFKANTVFRGHLEREGKVPILQKVAGEATLAGSPAVHRKIQVDVEKELYFEQGELRVPATFDSTSEERKAGFP